MAWLIVEVLFLNFRKIYFFIAFEAYLIISDFLFTNCVLIFLDAILRHTL